MLLGASIITVSALVVYYVNILKVGLARAKYDVQPPAVTGDPNFERAFRVQQNMLEQLILFLPLLWIFAYYVSELWAVILGSIWIVGRVLFSWGYYQEAKKRTLGFGISGLSVLGLLLGSLVTFGLLVVQQFTA